MTNSRRDSIDSIDVIAVPYPREMTPGGGAALMDDEEVKTTIRITRSLLRSAKVWAAQHDMSFNDAVIEALTRLTKGGAR